MNLVVATIPDDPADLPEWLERRLVGLELDGLAAELAAIHRPAASGPSLAQLLGGLLERVRASGLSCLSIEQLRRLLTRPELLMELQEDVLIHGGPYWDGVTRSMPMIALKIEDGRQRLPVSPTARRTTPSRAIPWYRQAWLVSLATAAAVLVAVGVWQWTRPNPAAVAWGWQRPGAAQEDATAADYLNGLASSADEWFNKRPEDASSLAKRITQMRLGCSELTRAPHRPLAPADRKWLVERCQTWAKKFDAALTALDAGEDPAQVRERMDEAVNSLTTALRERAKQV